MDRKTYDALEASIQKWEKLVKTPLEKALLGPHHCPLCLLFHSHYREDENPVQNRCVGCPVCDKTGRVCCVGTPYDDVEWAMADHDEAKFRSAAKRELAFLKSLRPYAATLTPAD